MNEITNLYSLYDCYARIYCNMCQMKCIFLFFSRLPAWYHGVLYVHVYVHSHVYTRVRTGTRVPVHVYRYSEYRFTNQYQL